MVEHLAYIQETEDRYLQRVPWNWLWELKKVYLTVKENERINFNLQLRLKTKNRDITVWSLFVGHINDPGKIIKKIVDIAQNNADAILHFKDPNEQIQEFAQIKIDEFSDDEIDVSEIKDINYLDDTVCHAAQLLL